MSNSDELYQKKCTPCSGNTPKIDTNEIRIMPCTLNQDLMDDIKLAIKNIRPESTSIVVYALDKKAIRDVRVNTIQDWYIGTPDA